MLAYVLLLMSLYAYSIPAIDSLRNVWRYLDYGGRIALRRGRRRPCRSASRGAVICA